MKAPDISIVSTVLVLVGGAALTTYAFYNVSESTDAANVILPLVNGSGACK
jgi:hypothetical protein